jgi:hypothetical protein
MLALFREISANSLQSARKMRRHSGMFPAAMGARNCAQWVTAFRFERR